MNRTSRRCALALSFAVSAFSFSAGAAEPAAVKAQPPAGLSKAAAGKELRTHGPGGVSAATKDNSGEGRPTKGNSSVSRGVSTATKDNSGEGRPTKGNSPTSRVGTGVSAAAKDHDNEGKGYPVGGNKLSGNAASHDNNGNENAGKAGGTHGNPKLDQAVSTRSTAGSQVNPGRGQLGAPAQGAEAMRQSGALKQSRP